jgi:hypothetical protein
MRTVWMIPLAYVAGIEGFGWFVPYLLFVCGVATISRMRNRHARLKPVPVAIASLDGLELEAAPA